MKTTIEQGVVADSVRKGVLPDYGIEIGQKFYFTRNSRITKLGCKMPENTGNKIAGVKVPVSDITRFAYVITISLVTVTAIPALLFL